MQDKTIAIIGASADRAKFGNKAVRAYRQQGYSVYPVNPRGGTIEGLPVYASILDVPVVPDQVSLYIPPERGLEVIEDVASKGVRSVWFNPGSESQELLDRAAALGLEPVVACSILGVGMSPTDL